MAGGKIGALIHPSEFVTIGGATLGALILMSPKKILSDLFRGILQAFKGSLYAKPTCNELFRLLYALARLVRQEGLLALDTHVTNPDESELFRQFPKINQNHHARTFICDALALTVDGTAETAQLSKWLD